MVSVHPDASPVPLESQADLDAARVMARELCGLVGVRNYHAQTVVTTVGALGSKILAQAQGQLTLRIDPEAARLFVSATLPVGTCTEDELRELAKTAHHIECGSDDSVRRIVASFDYELLRQ